ncbi:MAG: prepilin-type N-terminal cleavage/methylation domain-containing protein [Thermodesulfobacteriota bacterium]|nr:prepilin-type N-terminal cleavage/methylation domain-containing protein [Thermodesulfobacteriota bacterium]
MQEIVGNHKGFTLIELMIVITIVGILANLAVPMYKTATTRAKEAVLKEDLYNFRQVIDQYYVDNGEYPEAISTLVDSGYLRCIPVDPFTGSKDSWIVIPPPSFSEEDEVETELFGVYDVHSGSDRISLNGTPYNEW